MYRIRFVICLSLCVAATVWGQQRTADQLSMAEKIKYGESYHTVHAEAVDPFRVVGNIYSIGTKNIGIYLIATDAGHILIDTGVAEMHDMLKANITRLGFKVSDIKILLSTHAHYDHVQGHEAMRKATGAQVMAVGLDAEALRLGKDISPLGFEGWEPVVEVKTLAHGDKVSLGASTLVAHQIPGHTQGCTVWSTFVNEGDAEFNVAVFGCRGPNSIVKVKDNAQFPDLIEQSLLGFERLLQIQPDIYISNHPESDWEKFGEALKAEQTPQPLLRQQPWRDMVNDLLAEFKQRIQ